MRRLPALAGAVLIASISFGAAPDKGEATRQLAFGVRMAEKGSWHEAAFRFGKAVRADEGNAAAQNDLGVALESIGEYSKAAAAYAKALEIDPANAKIRENGDRLKAYLATRNDPKAAATPAPAIPAQAPKAPQDPNAAPGSAGGGGRGR
ncbi:MAG: tetratricopeptide repeat protein [Acidobacteria bacterium]|nr:tetratricopeptide repeat protein [Acidobacteriota bacterium]